MATLRHSMVAPVLLSLLPAALGLLGACELFYDPAAPPFDDRLMSTVMVDDVFGDLRRSDVEMTVLDNGSRRYLLVRGRDKGGGERTVAFDEDLKVRMSRSDVWDIRNAFVDVNGNFVVERMLFDRGFSLEEEEIYDNPPDSERVTGVATPSGVVLLGVENHSLEAGPLYDSDWNGPSGISSNDIHPDADANAREGFRLKAAQHDVGRARSGLVLWNDALSRVFVIEVSASLAVDMQDPGLAGGTFVTDEARYITVSARDYDPVFYTRRGVVVLRDKRDHEVFDIDSGERLDTYHVASNAEFAFAYSPDGRWVYTLDKSRLRLYKARTWW